MTDSLNLHDLAYSLALTIGVAPKFPLWSFKWLWWLSIGEFSLHHPQPFSLFWLLYWHAISFLFELQVIASSINTHAIMLRKKSIFKLEILWAFSSQSTCHLSFIPQLCHPIKSSLGGSRSLIQWHYMATLPSPVWPMALLYSTFPLDSSQVHSPPPAASLK